jgi:hypothetical protein
MTNSMQTSHFTDPTVPSATIVPFLTARLCFFWNSSGGRRDAVDVLTMFEIQRLNDAPIVQEITVNVNHIDRSHLNTEWLQTFQ